jgi:hypothetical protein
MAGVRLSRTFDRATESLPNGRPAMNSHLLSLAVTDRNADLLARADADRRARAPRHAVARLLTRHRAGAAARPGMAGAAMPGSPAAGCG